MTETDKELDSLARQYTTSGTGFYSGMDWNNTIISICECGVPGYEDMSDESALKLIKKICDIYLGKTEETREALKKVDTTDG